MRKMQEKAHDIAGKIYNKNFSAKAMDFF